jgi:uncharacterized protein (DUF1697 family)
MGIGGRYQPVSRRGRHTAAVREQGQVSLLRGINVGGNAIVSMARLRSIYTALDLEDVKTHLQSGNVVFRSARSAAAISLDAERTLKAELGLAIRVLGRTHAELTRIVAADPFPGAEPSRHVVVFLSAAPSAGIKERLEALATGGESVVLGRHELHIHYPEGLGRSKVGGAVIERGGVVATARNWRTVTRLAELTGLEA